MIAYLWVALGSALGGVCRYGFGLLAARLWGEAFPWGTIVINIVGSFVIGFFGTLTLAEGAFPASPNLRIFVMVGICGGFTTFSSFSLQTLSLARDGSWLGATSNVALSVALCLAAVTIGHVSAERIGFVRTEASAMSRTILALLDRQETAPSVLASAALAAERLGGARIVALHVRHDVMEGFMPTEDVMTKARAADLAGEAARRSAALQAIFTTWQAGSRTGEWREVAGPTEQSVATAAADAALVVIGHGGGGHGSGAPRGDAKEAVHVALFDARRTALLVPQTVPAALGRRIAIAWKPSEAADRAVEAALPLLLGATEIVILMAGEDGGSGAAPDSLIHRLEKAQVPTRLVRFETGHRHIGEALLAEARIEGADLLVMGAYTHSRLAELVLGGATREILASADLPVLMHH